MTLAIAEGLKLPKGSRFSIGAVPAAIAGVAPTLDYRPALERREIEAVSLSDKLTFFGGNQGTFVGSDGYIQRAQTNVPRFRHDPLTRRSLGMLLEASRTNSIRNNTIIGAVAGTYGTTPTNWNAASANAGISREITGTGTENGITYIDIKYAGTSTGSGVINIVPDDGVTASSGQAWTSSAYVTLVGGSLANLTLTHRIRQASSGGGFLGATDQTLSPVSGNLIDNRYSVTLSSAPATIATLGQYFILAFASSGLAIDITLRIGLPQLEQGATASSVIPTTTTTVTRPADSAVLDGTGIITGTYTMVEKPEGCAVINGTDIELQNGFTIERVMVFPATLTAGQITAIRAAM